MPKVSAKRQITLPVELCREAGIEPGDDYQCFIADGHITVVKKSPGRAYGVLAGVKAKPGISDEESMRSCLKD